MRFKIPKDQNFSGIFEGEFLGTIWSAKSVDLERNKGKVGLADSYSDLFDSSEGGFSNLTTPIAFVRSSADNTDRWWLNGGRLFKTTNTNPETGWAEDAIASTPTAPLYDLIDFAGALLAPTSTNIDRLASGVWTNNWWSSLTGASALQALPHRFAILAGALLVTDGRFINDYDGTIVRDPALTLPVGFQANWIVTFGSLAFIGGSVTSGEAYIYTWDRVQTSYVARYPIGDNEALCGFVADSVYIVTKKGVIKRFNGSGFEQVQQFPSVEVGSQINSIHPNGVAVVEDIVKMFVDFGSVANDRTLSGVWNFDLQTRNLYNAGSVRNTTAKDYAQHEIAEAGALKQTVTNQGSVLIGARVYTNYPGTARYGIFSSDEGDTSNQGYFITPKIHVKNVATFWRYIIPVLRRMDNADDRVRLAARLVDSNQLPAYETITWTAANMFTSANGNIQAGDFVEVIAGENGGALARITSVSSGTVTIDRSLFSSTASSRVRYLRFSDIGNISNVQLQNARFIASGRSEWIQILCELRGTEISPSIESLLVDYKEIPLL